MQLSKDCFFGSFHFILRSNSWLLANQFLNFLALAVIPSKYIDVSYALTSLLKFVLRFYGTKNAKVRPFGHAVLGSC